MTNIGRAYKKLAAQLRQTAGEAVSEYSAACNMAADAISRSNAVEFGSRLRHPGVARSNALSRLRAGGSSALNRLAQ